jgi:cytochrome c553
MGKARQRAWLGIAAAGAIASGVIDRTAIQAAPGVQIELPLRLADTGLYEAGRSGVVDPANRPYAPQYPLWSDGAEKARWVYLPPGATIDSTDPDAWDFPVGTKFWKEFTLGGRKVETRVMWKTAPAAWSFASYIWNSEGTDAVKAPDVGVPDVAEVASGRRHAVPSLTDCRACHEARRVEVLGFTALQLSTDRDPNAVHAEPWAREMVTIRTLVQESRLAPPRPELVTHPPRIDARTPAERAALGYRAGNCGQCHNRDGELASLGLHWKGSELATGGAATARGMLNHPTKWQVPGVPEGESLLVNVDAPDQSALLRRMRSRRPTSQMPPLGSVVADLEGIEAIVRWIGEQRESR